MKRLAAWLALVGVCGMVFGWWGLETTAGRRQFDEMAGIIPLATGAGAFLLLLISCLIYLVARRR